MPTPTPEDFNAINGVRAFTEYAANAGNHYFSRATMRFFRSRLIRGVKHDPQYVYMRISDVNWNDQRVYSIVRMNSAGHVEKLPNAEHLPTLSAVNAVWRTL